MSVIPGSEPPMPWWQRTLGLLVILIVAILFCWGGGDVMNALINGTLTVH